MAKSLKDLMLTVIATSKTPLENHEIRSKLQSIRPGTSSSTIDSMLNQLSNAGQLVRKNKSSNAKSQSKYEYQASKLVTRSNSKVRKLVLETVSANSMIDRATVLSKVLSIKNPSEEEFDKVVKNVDRSLWSLAKNSQIQKSKNPMRDFVVSSQAKFVYFV